MRDAVKGPQASRKKTSGFNDGFNESHAREIYRKVLRNRLKVSLGDSPLHKGVLGNDKLAGSGEGLPQLLYLGNLHGTHGHAYMGCFTYSLRGAKSSIDQLHRKHQNSPTSFGV